MRSALRVLKSDRNPLALQPSLHRFLGRCTKEAMKMDSSSQAQALPWPFPLLQGCWILRFFWKTRLTGTRWPCPTDDDEVGNSSIFIVKQNKSRPTLPSSHAAAAAAAATSPRSCKLAKPVLCRSSNRDRRPVLCPGRHHLGTCESPRARILRFADLGPLAKAADGVFK